MALRILIVIVSGKKYIFDIQRTFREAYDHARRQLYRAEMATYNNGSVSSTCGSEVDRCQQQQCSDSSDYTVSIMFYIKYVPVVMVLFKKNYFVNTDVQMIIK